MFRRGNLILVNHSTLQDLVYVTCFVCRFLEVISYKVFAVQREDMVLESLNTASTKTYRIEEIPIDEVDIAEDETLIPVAHFQKVTSME